MAITFPRGRKGKDKLQEAEVFLSRALTDFSRKKIMLHETRPSSPVTCHETCAGEEKKTPAAQRELGWSSESTRKVVSKADPTSLCSFTL